MKLICHYCNHKWKGEISKKVSLIGEYIKPNGEILRCPSCDSNDVGWEA